MDTSILVKKSFFVLFLGGYASPWKQHGELFVLFLRRITHRLGERLAQPP